jgi:hypothetical protein
LIHDGSIAHVYSRPKFVDGGCGNAGPGGAVNSRRQA